MCCNEEHGHHHSRRHGGQCDESGHGECGCGRHGGHECGCEREHHHGHGHGHCGCCCEGEQGRHFRRHVHTREERLASLEVYLKDLQAEVKAVEEQMAELKAAQ